MRQGGQQQRFFGQRGANAGDGPGCAAVNETMVDLGIHTDHQRNFVILAGDVLCGVTQIISATEFLEANQVRVFCAQGKEQFRAGGKAVDRAVVDDRRHVWRRVQNGFEVVLLSRDGGTARQHAWDHHQANSTNFLRMGGMSHSGFGIDGTGAHNNRQPSCHQTFHAFHALGVGQQRPVAHGTTVDHGGHASFDHFLAFFDQRVIIRRAVVFARCHQRRHSARKNIVRHSGASPFPRDLCGRFVSCKNQ